MLRFSLVYAFWSLLVLGTLSAQELDLQLNKDTKSLIRRMFEFGHVKTQIEVWPTNKSKHFYLELTMSIPVKEIGDFFTEPSYQLDVFDPSKQWEASQKTSTAKKKIQISLEETTSKSDILVIDNPGEKDLIKVDSKVWLEKLGLSFSSLFENIDLLSFELGEIKLIDNTLVNTGADSEFRLNRINVKVKGFLNEASLVVLRTQSEKFESYLRLSIQDEIINLSSDIVDAFEEGKVLLNSGQSVRHKELKITKEGAIEVQDLRETHDMSFEAKVSEETWKVKSKIQYCFKENSSCVEEP